MKLTQEQFEALEEWVMASARYVASSPDTREWACNRMTDAHDKARELLVEEDPDNHDVEPMSSGGVPVQ